MSQANSRKNVLIDSFSYSAIRFGIMLLLALPVLVCAQTGLPSREYIYAGGRLIAIDTPLLPLAAPTNLAATAVSASQVDLRWNDNSSAESGFLIEQKVGSGNWLQVGVTNPDATSFENDTGLTPSTTYTYRVRAYSPTDHSAYSNESSATTRDPAAPTAPNNVHAVLQSSGITITISWSATSTNHTGFIVERCAASSTDCSATPGNWLQIATQLTTNATGTFTDAGLSYSHTYYYRVYAVNGAATSPASAVASATTANSNSNPPASPNLSTLVVDPSNCGQQLDIYVGWAATAGDHDQIQIERGSPYETWNVVKIVNSSTSGDFAFDDTVGYGTTYSYRVRAVRGNLASGPSNVKNAATPTQASPSNLIATGSGSSVTLSWSVPTNATNAKTYEIVRTLNGASQTLPPIAGCSTATTYTFSESLPAGHEYLYRVRAVDIAGKASKYSNSDWASTIAFEPLQDVDHGGTPIRAQHFIQLRQGINELRASAGLPAAAWTDSTITSNATIIRGIHLQELRTYLNDVFAALGVAVPTYTDPQLTTDVTSVRRVHINELRQNLQ
jgi:titin